MFFQVGLRSLKKMLLKYMVTSICFISAIIPREILGENCVEGQYWSKSFINPDGACVACPPKWISCYNQPINDQKRCMDSCREKPTTLPKKPTTGSTKITAFPTKTSNTIPVQQSELPTTSSVSVNRTKGDGANKHEKTRPETDERQHLKKEAATAVIVLSVLVFILLVLAVVLFVVNRNRQKSAGNEGEVGRSDVGRRLAQQQFEVLREWPLHHQPPIQATSASRIRIGGIADTGEDSFSSSLHLKEVEV